MIRRQTPVPERFVFVDVQALGLQQGCHARDVQADDDLGTRARCDEFHIPESFEVQVSMARHQVWRANFKVRRNFDGPDI